MKKSPLMEKSYSFAIKIVRLVQLLQNSKKEYILSKQILRSGTAIGALLAESKFAQSDADYIHKLSIALKEANETKYWISLLNDTEFIDVDTYNQYSDNIEEIIRMLVSSINTLKSKQSQ
jgi:four helix bundle protein